MSTHVIAERPATSAPSVTQEQLDLIKRTVASGATPDEIKLYLYDCARQGVHPLDKLVHFTKRQGKYIPITSIDFMRIRAAETNEYAGSDDALFWQVENKRDQPYPDQATVTVWRLVQGQRCSFTATARWLEYKPEAGQSGKGDAMWLKMPHTMLAKCAEALALRKGFPRQLAGLYAREELDRAGEPNGYTVSAPALLNTAIPPSEEKRENASVPNAGELGHPHYHSEQNHAPLPQLPAGAVTIREVRTSPTKNPNVTKAFVVLSDGVEVTTIKTALIALCEQYCQDGTAVAVLTKQTKWGTDLVAVHAIQEDVHDGGGPVDLEDIPF